MKSNFRGKFCQLALLVALVSVGAVFPQERFPRVLLEVPPDTVFVPFDSLRQEIQLPHKFLVPGSEQIHLRDFYLLRNIHYRIDYRTGRVQLIQTLPAVDSLRIVYRKYPFPLIEEYFHRELQTVAPGDSAAGDSGGVVAKTVRPKFLEEIESYQANLQKSGSIVRGIEVGSNQDLTLNSGLNLQLSGQIAPNVEILAALTDESTPIQPEGNTQTLREVDKVFVKLQSPHLGGTLGDFNLLYSESQFGNLQRKLQGISAENTYKNTLQQLTYGTSRGVFHSNRFLGQEGNQGPYLLTGQNGEREIIVLAGTEKVFVDGIPQTRGENNDYVIDYGLAQITFTNKKLITSENRIEVDFEYTSAFQRFGKTFIGASSQGQRIGRRVSYDVRVFREWDDTNNLLEDDAPLTPQEQAALATAGDDPLAAFVSGADSLGPGKGNYARADTVIDGQLFEFFKFVGPGRGSFRVRFTGVGAGNGSYLRVSLQEFRFVGPGRGTHLPLRLVPLAADKRLLNGGADLRLAKNWTLHSEFALSDFDRNVFSGVDDGDNRGGALQISSALRDSAFHFLGQKIGGVDLNLRWLRQDSAFAPLDRPLQPEYAYKWNFDQAQLTNEETSVEAEGSYQPARWLRLSGHFGRLEKGAGITSNRRVGQLELFRRPVLPDITLRAEAVESHTRVDNSEWRRQGATITKRIGKFTPLYQYRREDRAVEGLRSGRLTGFVFDDHHSRLNIRNLLGIDWTLNHQFRKDFLYNPRRFGTTLQHATTQTYQLQALLDTRSDLRGRFELTFREKDFTPFFQGLPADSQAIFQTDPQFQDTTFQDRQSHLANVELQYRNKEGTWSARWNYQVASELQAIREIRYLEVEENRGNFRFDSTLNEFVPDPQGNLIQFFFQTGDFRSVIRLESAWQVQYRPRPLSRRPSRGVWRDLRDKTSFLSYIKIEEQSRNANIRDIYLLRLDKFHNFETSLRSVYILNHDVHFNERNPDWGILLRSRYRDVIANQFLQADNNESRIVWERTVEARRRMLGRRLNVTLQYAHGFNKRWVAAVPSRNLNILSQRLTVGFNYRPGIRWQFQLDVERGSDNDRKSLNPLRVNLWNIKPQVAYSLRGKARATANLSYLNVSEAENPGGRPLPFEMGNGRKVGNSWLWNLRFDYFINQNVTINASYTGRKDANALRTIHLGKAEVRAFF